MNPSSGYEKTYNLIVQRLTTCDFEEAAYRLGFAPPVNGNIIAKFLGQEYRINSQGVEALDGLPSEPVDRCLLIYYITSKGSTEPSNTFCSPSSFTPVSFSSGDGNLEWMTAPITRKYGENIEGLKEQLKKLGAIYQGEVKSHKHIWVLRILPKILFQIVFYLDDGEFPSEMQLKLDNNINEFFEFEQIAFLCGSLIKGILRI